MKRESVQDMEYRGFRIGMYTDTDPESPREWSNVGTMVCWHRRYTLGDEQPSVTPDEYLANLAYQALPLLEEKHELSTARLEEGADYGQYPALRAKMEKSQRERIEQVLANNYLILPLHLYDHSGITMSTSRFSCPWDSGQVGFIYVSHAKVREEWGTKLEKLGRPLSEETLAKAWKYLEGEVETYDEWLTGNVYGFCTEHILEDGDTGDVIDSCWGYYGYDWKESGLLEAAKDSIDGYIHGCIAAHSSKLKTWIKNKVPLDKRYPLATVLYHSLKAPVGVCI